MPIFLPRPSPHRKFILQYKRFPTICVGNLLYNCVTARDYAQKLSAKPGGPQIHRISRPILYPIFPVAPSLFCIFRGKIIPFILFERPAGIGIPTFHKSFGELLISLHSVNKSLCDFNTHMSSSCFPSPNPLENPSLSTLDFKRNQIIHTNSIPLFRLSHRQITVSPLQEKPTLRRSAIPKIISHNAKNALPIRLSKNAPGKFSRNSLFP